VENSYLALSKIFLVIFLEGFLERKVCNRSVDAWIIPIAFLYGIANNPAILPFTL